MRFPTAFLALFTLASSVLPTLAVPTAANLAFRDVDQGAPTLVDASLFNVSEFDPSTLASTDGLQARAGSNICPHLSREFHVPGPGVFATQSFKIALNVGTYLVFGWLDSHGIAIERADLQYFNEESHQWVSLEGWSEAKSVACNIGVILGSFNVFRFLLRSDTVLPIDFSYGYTVRM